MKGTTVARAKGALKNVLEKPSVSAPVATMLRPVAKWLPDSLLFRVPVSGPFPVEIPGSDASFRLHGALGDSIGMTLCWRGLRAYEGSTVDVLARLSARTSVFLDVGANVGVYSLLMATINPRAQVHALEPVPSVFELLERNARLNRLTNLHLHQVAMADRVGVAAMYVPVDHAVPIEASMRPGHRPNSAPIEVRVATLDAFVRELGVPEVSVVKIDTEGTTAEVLQGAVGVLRQSKPVLICEVLSDIDSELRVGPILDDLGYIGFSLTPDGPKRSDQILGDPTFENLNYLFVHETRLAEATEILI